MKEMVYKPQRGEPELLHKDSYKGYHLAIVSLGIHPNVYVENKHGFQETQDFNGLYTPDEICRPCTFVNSSYWDDTTCSYLGFSFSHAGDYEGYYRKGKDDILIQQSKAWTTRELLEFCQTVINFLSEFQNQPSRYSGNIITMAKIMCPVSVACRDCWRHHSYLCPHIDNAVKLDYYGFFNAKQELEGIKAQFEADKRELEEASEGIVVPEIKDTYTAAISTADTFIKKVDQVIKKYN